jgi:hypothetical protein
MKKYMIKMVALLLFTTVAVSSCSLEYRQRHMRGGNQPGRDRDHHDDHNGDHHYDNNHRY